MEVAIKTVVSFFVGTASALILMLSVALAMWWWDVPVIGTGWWTGWDDPTWWQAAIWVGVLRIVTPDLWKDD